MPHFLTSRDFQEGNEISKRGDNYEIFNRSLLGLIQATVLTIGLFRERCPAGNAFSMISNHNSLTAGTAFLMWLGEQINEYGVGNISLIISRRIAKNCCAVKRNSQVKRRSAR